MLASNHFLGSDLRFRVRARIYRPVYISGLSNQLSNQNTNYCNKKIWQGSREDKTVVFTTKPIALFGFNPHPGHVVRPWIRRLTIIICLVTSNKQQIQWTRIEEIYQNVGSLNTSKQMRIPLIAK